MDRHHTEYVRKVRAQRHQREKKQAAKHKTQPTRQSDRTTLHSKEIDALKAIILEKDQQIDALSAMLDAQAPGATADAEMQTEPVEEDVVDLFLLLGP